MSKRRYEEIINYENDITYINKEINDLDDLIYLGEQYRPYKKYNINVEKLYNILPVLRELKNVIGMDNIKKTIVNQIIYFIQDFQDKNSDMMHTVIQGPPGVGKTMLGQIIGKIYFKMNIIEKNDLSSSSSSTSLSSSSTPFCCDEPETKLNINEEYKFIIAKRSDLIGKYLGHTAAKTQEVIDRSLGGVLFIDEAYSLGNEEGRDSFSKECIDTINQNLTEKKNQLLVIIAGYKESLDNCFFSYNEGLRRRFPFVYNLDNYKANEMSLILKKMIKDMGTNWDIRCDIVFLNKFFEKNKLSFINSAGDIETFVFNIKIEHSKRVLYYPLGSSYRKKITSADIEKAFNIYKENKKIKEESFINTLYS